MKRVGGIFDHIWDLENLRDATAKALKGKRDRCEVRKFADQLDNNLETLSRQIRNGTVSLGKFHQFYVRDPKKRLISAPVFQERVVHHAVMNVCEPVLESFSIFDSYACRKGKGQFAGIRRAEHFALRGRWFLKLDMRKYFDSVPKDRLLEKLARRFREKKLFDLMERLVWSFDPERDRGLPIGALTSQHFANFYLGYLDRFVKEELRFKGYVRYMDDFVLWSNDRARLKEAFRKVRQFVGNELELELNTPQMNCSHRGMDFLGYRVFPGHSRLNRRSRRRYKKRFENIQWKLGTGRISEGDAQILLEALTAFTGRAVCGNWRRQFYREFGSRPEEVAPIVSIAAATGTTSPATLGPPTATGTRQPPGTTTSASGCA